MTWCFSGTAWPIRFAHAVSQPLPIVPVSQSLDSLPVPATGGGGQTLMLVRFARHGCSSLQARSCAESIFRPAVAHHVGGGGHRPRRGCLVGLVGVSSAIGAIPFRYPRVATTRQTLARRRGRGVWIFGGLGFRHSSLERPRQSLAHHVPLFTRRRCLAVDAAVSCSDTRRAVPVAGGAIWRAHRTR